MKISVWDRMEIPDAVIKADSKISKEMSEMEDQYLSKTVPEMKALDDPIFQAYERVRRAGILRNDEELSDLNDDYLKLLRKKSGLKDEHRRRMDSRRLERENLLRPYRDSIFSLMEEMESSLMAKYICQLPDYRTTPSGQRELSVRGHRKPGSESDITYMIIRTNVNDIMRGKGLLTMYRAKVMQARNLSDLKSIRRIPEGV